MPVVIQDNREKVKTWDASYLGTEFTVKRKRLRTGDYTLKGLEDLICIEKKASWQEIGGNIKTKKARDNFLDELKRMQEFPIRLLVVHSDLSRIPHEKYFGQHVKPSIMYEWVFETCLQYGVFVLPIGSYATGKPVVRQMFRTLWDRSRDGRLFVMKNYLHERMKPWEN